MENIQSKSIWEKINQVFAKLLHAFGSQNNDIEKDDPRAGNTHSY